MNIGDHVIMSDKNLNHTLNDVCVYSGMSGIVTNICEMSILIVPMYNAFKKRIKGKWIILNGNLIFHKSISNRTSIFKLIMSWFNIN